MGILTEKVKKVFEEYDKGNFKSFCKGLVDVGDVRWASHRTIVDMEVEKELEKRNIKNDSTNKIK